MAVITREARRECKPDSRTGHVFEWGINFWKEFDYFPNATIAYRILSTIPVTVASAERSFSKLKLLKSYLRSTISQERLSGLAMIAIENGILEDINCEELINQFAMKNVRRASRIIG
ncbi:zinc finger MYM-type protein 1 [Artemisia annua]|uniref:Zinc finger MYM-type protein 1 n=1 Tax=Artemisia annua TaxID=35608 RepID=A0A2U1LU08_ARTAN|nr:zinc finger MYM-type protein 1 [Artemisia annua]